MSDQYSDLNFDYNAVEQGDFDHIQPGMIVGVDLYNAFNRIIPSLVVSNVYLQVGYMVDVIWQGKRKKIKVSWIKEFYDETG
jgi:hypothetical protein